MHVVKLAFNGNDTSSVVDFTNILLPKHHDLEKPKTCMKIYSKANYPLRTTFPSTLESLVINSCLLKKFDIRILKLANLKILDLKHNYLETLCDSFDDLTSLTCVHLTDNCFEQIPSCLLTGETSKHIKLLDLSDNKIKILSNKLANLKLISTLKLDRNCIEFLPSNIGQLKNLKYLHLARNKIKLIPWSFGTLQLNMLDLSSNLFHDELQLQFNDDFLGDIPTLFEISARYTIKNRYST